MRVINNTRFYYYEKINTSELIIKFRIRDVNNFITLKCN